MFSILAVSLERYLTTIPVDAHVKRYPVAPLTDAHLA